MSENISNAVWEYEKWGYNEAIITGYNGDETDVTVPEKIGGMTVTHIGAKAFYNKNITSIAFPDSLRGIGASAFENCADLASIKLPDSDIMLGLCQFKGCRSLADEHGFLIINNYLFEYFGDEKDVVIPENVDVICESAFENDRNITSVQFPESLYVIRDNAFSNCTNLSSLKFNGFPLSIGACVFKNCPKLADENGFIFVGKTLCEYTGNSRTVVLPEGTEDIAKKVFSDKTELVCVTLPSSLYRVYSLTFINCPKLSAVRMMQGTEIEEDAFINCPKIVDEKGYLTIGDASQSTVFNAE